MRIAIALLLSAGLIQAASSQTLVDTLNGPAPWWVLKGAVPATIDFDFAMGRYYQVGKSLGQSPGNLLTISRASTGYIDDLAGNWTSVASNLARISNKGLLVEEARTNSAKWARDLTQAGTWTAANITAALNAAGIDNTASAATTLTAGAANGTILQTVAVSAASYSVFLKRSVGTGEIDITNDGATWTNITGQINSTGFTRVSLANVTISKIGIRIVASGDAVIADFNQAEAGVFVTSPVLTTSAAVARAADVVTATNVPAVGSAATLFAAYSPEVSTVPTGQDVLTLDDGTGNNKYSLFRAPGTGSVPGQVGATGGGLWANGAIGGGAPAAGSTVKEAGSATNGMVVGAVNGTTSSTSPAFTFPTVNAVRIGSRAGNSNFANSYIGRIAVWPTAALSASAVVGLTK